MKVKLNYVIVMLAFALTLTACGAVDRGVAKFTGKAAKVCVDGVTYLQFTSGATVQVDRQGKPVACE